MKHFKVVTMGAVAAALVWGTGCRSEIESQQEELRQQQREEMQRQPGTGGSGLEGMQAPPAEDSMRGFPGQDSDVHRGTGQPGTGGSAPMAPPERGLDDTGRGGAGGLERDRANELGTGASGVQRPDERTLMPPDIDRTEGDSAQHPVPKQ